MGCGIRQCARNSWECALGIGITVSPSFSGTGHRGYSAFPTGSQVRFSCKRHFPNTTKSKASCLPVFGMFQGSVKKVEYFWSFQKSFISQVIHIWKENFSLFLQLTSFSYYNKTFSGKEDIVMRLIKIIYFLLSQHSLLCAFHFVLPRFELYQQYFLQHFFFDLWPYATTFWNPLRFHWRNCFCKFSF